MRDDPRHQGLSTSRPPGDCDRGAPEALVEHVLAALEKAAEPRLRVALEIVRGVDETKGNVFGWEHASTPNARVVPIENA